MKQRGNQPIPLNVTGKENALWAENQRLRAELEEVSRRNRRTIELNVEYLTQRDEARALVAAVRALHKPTPYTEADQGDWCEECEQMPWPCATIAALDGKEERERDRWRVEGPVVTVHIAEGVAADGDVEA